MSGWDDFRVSVVIPAYNAELFIEKAVHSCLDQSEVDEVIIINDGSTDATCDISEQLKKAHSRVKLLQTTEGKPKGPAIARNLGIDQAQSPIITFLDADDYWLTGRFDRIKKIIQQDSSYEAIYEPAVNINTVPCSDYDDYVHWQGKPVLTFSPKTKGMLPIERWLLDRSVPCHIGLTIQKDALTKIGGYDPNLNQGEDTDLNWRIARELKCYYDDELSQIKVVRVVHGRNMSKNVKSYKFIDYLYRKHADLLGQDISIRAKAKLAAMLLTGWTREESYGYIGRRAIQANQFLQLFSKRPYVMTKVLFYWAKIGFAYKQI